jgi:hypothetical protein
MMTSWAGKKADQNASQKVDFTDKARPLGLVAGGMMDVAMSKPKKWRRVELPEVDVTEVSRAFEDAIGRLLIALAEVPNGYDHGLKIMALQSLKSRVLRVLRAARDGRVYRRR